MRKFVVIFAVAVVACQPASQTGTENVNFDSVAPLNATAQRDSDRTAELIRQRFNRNAKAINQRMKDAYLRGVQVCQNLKEAGYANRDGCPRPMPNYVPLQEVRPS